ncbi:bifunctional lysylphosphatidylglycerol flippase/synthetase MprF [Amycolatopsis sp. CA-230715]|uniref:bifunctional lysylphosphatidylglycerol flippase/synthetase MprF n=1 Tax=Amycolatopsis sp. CA-230715 TaxID=2745196 RepID=UPI001C01EA06|nr:DUF2156 domain-containing protein [Amycolatopsis sp. CA-230715]QWF84654.1 hypothetical protein HUW46_08105 [Amycolatopsis sp. CA-230715]
MLLVRRLPFTAAVTFAMLVVAVVSGALWSNAQDASWFPHFGYGLPPLEEGRWWTLFTGPMFAIIPVFYLPMAGGFALLVGFTEWRLGTRRTMAVTIAGQLVSVLGAALFLSVFQGFGWDWADTAGVSVDAGFSGGALAAVAVVSAAVRSPWRLRIRAALCVYVAVSIIYIGTLADLVHFIAVALALPLSGVLVGKYRAHRTGAPNKREWRLLAIAGLVLVTIAQAVMWLIPRTGPFGPSDEVSMSFVEVAVLVLGVALIVNWMRRGSRVAWRWAIAVTATSVLTGVAVALLIVLDALGGDPDWTVGVPLFVADSLLWTVELIVLLAARRAFRVHSRRHPLRPGKQHGTTDPVVATRLLGEHGGGSLSWMTTWPENSHFGTADGRSYVAYRKHARVAIGVGDPVAPHGDAARAVHEFVEMCDDTGMVPCLFSVSAETAVIARQLGWQIAQVAEDTLLDLETLKFRGKAWQDVRSSINRARKENIEFRLVTLAEQPRSLIAQVRRISDEWVSDKGMPEMGFTLGGVEEALDPRTRVGLAIDEDGEVHGVTSWMPVHTGDGKIEGWTLDVMRRRGDGFRPVMEFLIASSCLAFQTEGARFVSLSGAPLAKSHREERTPAVEQVMDSLGAMLEPYYGFRSLHAFKAKFMPRYEPLYLAFRDEADLPRIGIALGKAYLPDTGLLDLIRCMKSHRHPPRTPAPVAVPRPRGLDLTQDASADSASEPPLPAAKLVATSEKRSRHVEFDERKHSRSAVA